MLKYSGINIAGEALHMPEHWRGSTHLPAAAHGRCPSMAQLPHVRVGEALFTTAARQAHTWQRQCALPNNYPSKPITNRQLQQARSFGQPCSGLGTL